MRKHEDLVGNRYGRLVVVSLCKTRKRGSLDWVCKCDCGNITRVVTAYLKGGNTRSCGCMGRDTRLARESKKPAQFLPKDKKSKIELSKCRTYTQEEIQEMNK